MTEEKIVDRVGEGDGEEKARLTPAQCHMTREAGTERALTGRDWTLEREKTSRCSRS